MKEAAPSVSIHTIFEVGESGVVEQVETVSDEVGLLEGLEAVQVGMSLFSESLTLGRRIAHYARQARLQGEALKFHRNVWSPKGRFRFEVGGWPKPEGGFSIALSPITGTEAPEQRAQLHRDIVEHANDAIVVCEGEPIDLPGPRILFVNPAFERMTGYKAAEVVGLTPRILQGPGTDRVTLDRMRAAVADWQPIDVTVRNYRKDGSELWMEIHLEPVRDEAGWYTHWIGVHRDITERRENEHRLRLLEAGIDQIEKPLFLTDASFAAEGPRIVFANAGAGRARVDPPRR